MLDGLESDSDETRKQLASMSDQFSSIVKNFEDRLDELGKSAALLEVLREDAEVTIGEAAQKIRTQADALELSVSGMENTQAAISGLEQSVRQSGEKLSAFLEQSSQRVFDMSEILDNVSKIEKSIESQTTSMKSVVEFIREFMDGSRTNQNDLFAFRDRIGSEMKNMLDMVDERTSDLKSASNDVAALRSQMEMQIEGMNRIQEQVSDAARALESVRGLGQKIEDANARIESSAKLHEDASTALIELSDANKRAAEDLVSAASKTGSALDLFNKRSDDILNALQKKSQDIVDIEKAAQALSSVEPRIGKDVERLSSSLDELKNISRAAEDFISSQKSVSEELEGMAAITEESVKATKSALKRMETSASEIARSLEEGTASSLEAARKSVEHIEESSARLVDRLNDISSELAQEFKSVHVEAIKQAAQNLEQASKSISESLSLGIRDAEDVMGKIMERSISDLGSAAESALKRLDDTVENAAARLSSMLPDSRESGDAMRALQKAVAGLEERSDEISQSISYSAKEAANLIGIAVNQGAEKLEESASKMASLEEKISALSDAINSLSDGRSTNSRDVEELKEHIKRESEAMKEMIESVGLGLEDAVNEIRSKPGDNLRIEKLSEELSLINSSIQARIDGIEKAIEESIYKMGVQKDSNGPQKEVLDALHEAAASIGSASESLRNASDELAHKSQSMEKAYQSAAADVAGVLKDATSETIESLSEELQNLGFKIETVSNQAIEAVQSKASDASNLARQISEAASVLDSKLESVDKLKVAVYETGRKISDHAQLIEKSASGIEETRALLAKGTEELLRAASDLRSTAQQSEDSVIAQKAVSAELRETSESASETTKSMKSFQEDVFKTVDKFDRKTDDILNIMLGKTRELEHASVLIEKNAASLKESASVFEKAAEKIALVKLASPRKRSSRKAAKPVARARPRRQRIRPAPRKEIEDEALDVLIINSLRNVSMNMDSLTKATKTPQTRLRKRLNVLMTRGVIGREKRGRSIFFVLRLDEETRRDN